MENGQEIWNLGCVKRLHARVTENNLENNLQHTGWKGRLY